MTYIENIFICLAIPMILSLLFTRGRQRMFTLFVILEWQSAFFLRMSAVSLWDIMEWIRQEQ